jgi:hypothetical protein
LTGEEAKLNAASTLNSILGKKKNDGKGVDTRQDQLAPKPLVGMHTWVCDGRGEGCRRKEESARKAMEQNKKKKKSLKLLGNPYIINITA